MAYTVEEEFNVYGRNEKNRKIPCVHCLNHKLNLIVLHAKSVEQASNDFLHVCVSLYNFFRKSTVALHYDGEKLKRLLEQRWTGHLVTETAVLNSFQDINFASPRDGYFKGYIKQKHV